MQQESDIILVVDLDGTLVKSDMLFESFWSVISKQPSLIFKFFYDFGHGGLAYLKEKIANIYELDASMIPYNQAIIDLILERKSKGSKVALVTASDQKVAENIAKYLGLFDEVFASDGHQNLKGNIKANLLIKQYGAKNFDYVGNSRADIPVWNKARRVITSNIDPILRKRTSKIYPNIKHMNHTKLKMISYVAALRPHQWVKNALIFLPAISSAQIFSTDIFMTLCISFIAFSLVASSGYLFNDLLDLEADRNHPEKKTRPLAAGQISLLYSTLLIFVLLVIGSLIALLFVNIKFFLILSTYFLLTTIYSLYLKRKIIIDIVSLAVLYTLRVIAGGLAVDLPLSVWILAFSMFIFMSLAAVKRLSELVENASKGQKNTVGRSYKTSDITIIGGISLASGYISVLVSILHIYTEATQEFYSRPEILLGICPILIYWITRMILLTHRGEMHHDPILFSIRDNTSRFSIFLIILIAIVAKV